MKYHIGHHHWIGMQLDCWQIQPEAAIFYLTTDKQKVSAKLDIS